MNSLESEQGGKAFVVLLFSKMKSILDIYSRKVSDLLYCRDIRCLEELIMELEGDIEVLKEVLADYKIRESWKEGAEVER